MEHDTEDSASPSVFDVVVQYKHHALILGGITAIVSKKAPRKILSTFPDIRVGDESNNNGILVLPSCYNCFSHHLEKV